MKAIFLPVGALLFFSTVLAQNPTTSYTNGINVFPPTTPPDPAYRGATVTPVPPPSSTGTNLINPGSISPVPTGSNSYPTTPGTPQTHWLLNDLLQDPMRTPRNPKMSGEVKTVDGSSGKYRGQHKFTPAKKNGFTTNRRTRGVSSKNKRVKREKGS